jgi:cbb3-type cytochrome oxidase subunit 1
MMSDGMRGRLPPRGLPTFYIALAHLSLALAFALIAVDPRGAAGFFYHSRMLAIVHLVTLGWITASILGALYIVGPVALRMRIAAGRLDYAAASFVAIGVIGMVGHFWIQEYEGMAWSGATVGAGILAVGVRLMGPLQRARVPAAIRVHVALAFVNICCAAIMGVLLGINRVHPFLPGFVLNNVFAHAHLAAIGWAAMMVVGVSYRLLPMVPPAEMPRGLGLWTSALLLRAGRRPRA